MRISRSLIKTLSLLSRRGRAGGGKPLFDRPVRSLLWAIAGATLALPALAADEARPAGTPAASAADDTNLGRFIDILGVESPVASEEALQAIAKSFSETPDSGAQRHIDQKKVRVIGLRTAAMQALQKNLGIKAGGEAAQRIRTAIQEAEAVFNPVFNVSVGYQQDNSFERSRFGAVFLQKFNPLKFNPGLDLSDPLKVKPSGVPGQIKFPLDPLVPATKPQVDQMVFVDTSSSTFTSRYCQAFDPTTRVCLKDVKASAKTPNGPTETMSYNLSVQQQLPWGPAFRISTFTTERNVIYNSRGDSFNRDFATNLVLQALIPIPGSKDFGPNAPADVNVRLSEKAADRADWDLKTIINSTLLATDVNYWNLVRTIEQLAIRIEYRRLVEKQVEHTNHFFEQGLTTAYGKAQVDAELARARTLEELAKAALIAASDALSLQIEQSGSAADPYLLLPRDYMPLLENLLVVNSATAVQDGLKNRPDLAAQKVSKQASEIALEFARHQTRPDVSLTANVTSAQDSTQIGYQTYWKSLRNVTDPDNLAQSYTGAYRYPWGNRTFKARATQAEKRDQDQAVAIRSLENDVGQQVNDALAGVFGARARVDLAEKNLQFSQSAYDKLAQRRETGGDVRELELITKSQDVLNAKLARINALIDNKIAESQLLAAEGIIASTYGEATAHNDFERHRLEALNHNSPLQYFAQLLGRLVLTKTSAVAKND